MNYLMLNTTSFHQELKGGHLNDQVEQLIQHYNINIFFQQSLLVKEFLIFHYLKNYKIQLKDLLIFKRKIFNALDGAKSDT